MLRFLVRMLITGAGVFGVAYYSGGTLLQVDGLGWAVLFAAVLGFLNGAIRPIIKVLALPLTIVTLGLFSLLINLGFFYLAAALTPGVRTVGFWPSAGAAIIIAIFSGFAGWITSRDESAEA
jgi:putative membrane protein